MTTITIIGGGIAGLTTAVALQHKNIPFQIYEAADELKPVGAGIILSPNALYIFDQLGLYPALEQAGHPLHRFDIADQNGQTIQKNNTNFSLHGRAYHSISIHRGALQQILLDQLPPESIHLGKRLSQLNSNNGAIHFDDGTSTSADTVLGCDGIHSQVRQTLFPEAQLRYSGQTCWRGVATTALTQEQLATPAELWGYGVRFGYVPLSQTKTYWYATAVQPANQPNSPTTTLKSHLHTLFQRFPPFIRQIIDVTAVDHIMRHDLYDLQPLSTWHHGRSLLIGDAAHAMTPNLGQGAAQSIEDAWAIAHTLNNTPSLQDAFTRYEAVRYAKATQVSKTSWQLGQVTNWQNSFLCQFRNTLFKLTPPQLANKQRQQLFSVPSPEQLFRGKAV